MFEKIQIIFLKHDLIPCDATYLFYEIQFSADISSVDFKRLGL